MGAANDIGSNATLLGGARVLVVEDDFLIGLELSAILSDAGAEVVGPLSTVQSALHAAHDGTLSAAILDVRLGNQTVVPVARQLSDQHVPFFFYTGQSKADPLQAEWPDCGVLSKRAVPNAIVKAVAALLGRRSSSSAAR